jgi:hypothetical protein
MLMFYFSISPCGFAFIIWNHLEDPLLFALRFNSITRISDLYAIWHGSILSNTNHLPMKSNPIKSIFYCLLSACIFISAVFFTVLPGQTIILPLATAGYHDFMTATYSVNWFNPICSIKPHNFLQAKNQTENAAICLDRILIFNALQACFMHRCINWVRSNSWQITL